ncbi:FAS1-like dehydratase domain-containing protein [Sphingopyxis sp. 550A]
MNDWDAWIGRSETRHDHVEAAQLVRWLATFDRPGTGSHEVPQGFHWCLATPDAPTTALGPDGHPRRDGGPDGFLPPVPLPRRMWAASKVEFLAPLCAGRAVERVSRIASVTEKSGGSGRLVFVEVEHDTRSDGETLLRETQSIVYREAAPPDAPLAPPVGDGSFDPASWELHREIRPSEALLFRYSALTFNSHRIHYDLAYARNEERYHGLVVQGPLTATMLLDLARRRLGDNRLRQFAFRGLSPAISSEPLHLVLRGEQDLELAAFAGDGRQVMQASASC